MIKRYNIISILCAVMISACLPLSAQEEETNTGRLRWKPVDGAIAYRIEIRDRNARILLRRKVQNPAITFVLPVGQYQCRVAAVNKFSKTGRWGRWFGFSIRRSLRPQFLSLSPDEISPEGQPVRITVRGANFLEGCTVSLKKNNAITAPDNIIVEGRNSVSFTINPLSLATGEFDLVITNPGGNSISVDGALAVTGKPEISSVRPSSVKSDSGKITLTVRGSNFMKTASVTLKKGSVTVNPESMKRISREEIEISITPTAMGKGYYDLVLTNPGGNSRTLSRALTVGSEPSIHLGISGNYNMLLPQWNSIMDNSFMGGELYLGYHPLFFNSFRFLKHLGIEASLAYMQHRGIPFPGGSLRMISGSGGLAFEQLIFSHLSMVLHCGSGLQKTDINVKITSEKASSYDTLIYAGASFRIYPHAGFFIEPGSEYRHVLSLNENIKSIRSYLRLGYRF